MLRVFYCMIIVCFTNNLNASEQNFRMKNIPQLDNHNWPLHNYTDKAEHASLSANSECSRYYIKPPEDQVMGNAIIVWNISQNTLMVFYDGHVSSHGDSHYMSKLIKSILYVNIGCENSTFTNGTIDNDIEFPALARASDGNIDEEFAIKNETRVLKIKVEQKTNFTSLLLEMPLVLEETENYGALELSLMRNSVTNDLHVTMINPSAGKWRIKLRKNEIKNFIDSIYIHHDIIKMRNITSVTTPKKVNSPHKLLLRDTDDFRINSTEENTMKVKSNHTKILNKYARIVTNNIMNGLIMGEENDALADLTQRANGLKSYVKTLVVDLAIETKLIVPPTTIQSIIFTIKNYLPTTIFCEFRGSSSQFRILIITPPAGWIRSGEIFKVAVYIQIPNANGSTLNTITLHVEHQLNFEDVMKSAYVYVEDLNTMIADCTKPTIDYSFNNNCAGKLDPERCGDNEWSTEITVMDNESGVRNVVSQPDGIQPKSNFIAGMKGSVHLQYRSSCCDTTVRITAIDVMGNSYTREIDVTAWNNLTVGEIAAIVVGVLFLLFLIILIISLCIYCMRKRKSKDITFTQRYGSRSNPNTERTNF